MTVITPETIFKNVEKVIPRMDKENNVYAYTLVQDNRSSPINISAIKKIVQEKYVPLWWYPKLQTFRDDIVEENEGTLYQQEGVN